MHGRRACGHHFQSLPTNPGGSHVRECERDLPTDRRADGKVHQRFHFTPPEVHARGYIAITSSLIEYLLAKLLSFQGFIVIFGVGSLSQLLLLLVAKVVFLLIQLLMSHEPITADTALLGTYTCFTIRQDVYLTYRCMRVIYTT